MSVPETYYEAVDTRLPGHGEDLPRLQRDQILIDGAPGEGQGLLLQIFTETVIGPIFFEIIERKGNEGFGEGNFRALFESIERDQIRRGVLTAMQRIPDYVPIAGSAHASQRVLHPSSSLTLQTRRGSSGRRSSPLPSAGVGPRRGTRCGVKLPPEYVGTTPPLPPRRSSSGRGPKSALGVEVAIDQFDERHRRVVAIAETGLDNAGVAAGPISIALGQCRQQLSASFSSPNWRSPPPRMQPAALAERDQPLDDRPQILGLWQGRADLLMLDQRGGEVSNIALRGLTCG